MNPYPDPELPMWVAPLVFRLHDRIRDLVRHELALERGDELSRVAHVGAGDVSFQIDVPAEELVRDVVSRAPEPVVVIAEGIGTAVFPPGRTASAARVRLIVDPLDGSRELMYQKRSAFVLTGAAPNYGDSTDLSHIAFGVVTEIPPTAQSQSVRMWATRGRGVRAQLWDLTASTVVGDEFNPTSSGASSIRGGFTSFVHYFPGSHGPIGALADEVLSAVLGPVTPGSAAVFEDSYISTGGQLYLLASGRYRLIVDARPLLATGARPLCAHPYDLAGSALIAEEAGAVLTDLSGAPLRYPLDTDTNVGFVAYANPRIRDEVWPSLSVALRRLG